MEKIHIRDKGSWIQTRKRDGDNDNILSAITESCLDVQVFQQNIQITSASLYINSRMEKNFTAKEVELQKIMKQKPQQMFAFGLVQLKVHATEVCEKSAFSTQVLHVPLGVTQKGVNVVKHADVLMNWAHKKRIPRPWLIVYRIMKGRSKEVRPRFTSQAPMVKPTPNADSHVCKTIQAKSDLIHDQLNQSQIYLYELVDGQGNCRRHPRHCLPYAVVSFKQRLVSLPKTLGKPDSNKRRLSSTSREESPGYCSARSQRRSVSDLSRSTSPLSQNDGLALSKYLETSNLSMEELDSTRLDSKLDEIKQEREEVMLKLKAIQSMREAIESGSCTSGSEQELDKTLSRSRSDQKQTRKSPDGEAITMGFPAGKVGRSKDNCWQGTSGTNTSNRPYEGAQRNMDDTLKHDAVDVINMHHGGDEDGRKHSVNEDQNPRRHSLDGEHSQRRSGYQGGRRPSQEFIRPERSGPSFSRRDPYHWSAPHHENNMMDFMGSMDGDQQQMEYCNVDEQSDMFDLDELFYAAQSKLVKRVLPLKLQAKPSAEKTGRSNEDAATPTPSNTKVEDMEIDESSQSSLSHGSNLGFDAHQGDNPNPLTSPGFNLPSINKSIKDAEPLGTNNNNACQNYGNQESSDTGRGNNNQQLSASFALSHIACNSMEDMQGPGTNRDSICQDYGTPESRGSTSNLFPPSPGFDHTSYNSMGNLQPLGTIQPLGTNRNNIGSNYGTPNAVGIPSNPVTPSPGVDCTFYNPMEVMQTPGTNIDGVGLNYSTPESQGNISNPLTPSPGFDRRSCNIMENLQPPGTNQNNIGPNYGTPESRSNTSNPLTTSPGFSHAFYNTGDKMHAPEMIINDVCPNDGTQELRVKTSNPVTPSPCFNHTSYNSMENMQPPGTNINKVCQNYGTPDSRVNPSISVTPSSSFHTSYNRTEDMQASGSNTNNLGPIYGTPDSTCNTSNPLTPSPGFSHISYNPMEIIQAPGTNNDTLYPNYSATESRLYSTEPTRSLGFTSYKHGGDIDTQERNIGIVYQNYNSLEATNPSQVLTLDLKASEIYDPSSYTSPLDMVAPGTDRDFTCQNYDAQESPDNPSSDFHTSQVISCGSDGRLRLGSTAVHGSNSIVNQCQDKTATAFQRPPSPHTHSLQGKPCDDIQGSMSPPSTNPFVEAKMSPPLPLMPHFEYESNLVAIDPSDTIPTETPLSAMPPADGSKQSEGTMSAVLALQKKMDQTKDAIQRCALRVAMNTLLSKPPIDKAKPKDKLITLPDTATPIPKEKKSKLFYGYPLIKRGKKPPRTILLEPEPGTDSPLQDPRPLCSIKLKVFLRILPWAKYDPNIKMPLPDTMLVGPECDKTTKPMAIGNTQSIVNKPNIRDPRIRKQILKDALNAASTQVQRKGLHETAVKKTRSVDDDIICLGTLKPTGSGGGDTPESGELCDSPVYQDTRTVVVIRGDHSCDKDRGDGEAAQQPNIMDKLRYVQDLNASRPKSIKRKVVVHKPQDVFDRLGIKGKCTDETDSKQSFDLRHKIKGKKIPPLTGYNMRDEFLHSESSNDSSVVELKPALMSQDKETDNFNWFNNDISKQKDKSSYEIEMEAYSQARDDLRQTLSRSNKRNLSGDKYTRERSVDRHSMDRDRQRDRDIDHRSRRSSTEREYDRGRERCDMDRDRNSKDRNQQSKYTRDRSLSLDGSSQRSFSTERSSKRSWSIDGSSQQSWSMEGLSQGSSQGSMSKDRVSVQRSTSNRSCLSPGNEKEYAISTIYSTGHPNQIVHNSNMGDARRTPISRSSSVSSCGHQKQPNTFDSLGDRLEKEHGISQAKKRKYSGTKQQRNKGDQSRNDNPSYKNLSASLSALKQSVNDGIRSFKELNNSEMHSRIGKYKDRYKELQDLSIRALECHYQQNRVPTDLDTTIQQHLLEIITEIEMQQEGLDKYKITRPQNSGSLLDDHWTQGSASRERGQSTRGGRDGGRQQKVLDRKTSPELANQMYDRWQNQKYGTNSPARSTSGSTRKKRCP